MQKCTRFAFYSIKLKKWGARNKLLPFLLLGQKSPTNLLTNYYKRGKIKMAKKYVSPKYEKIENPDSKGNFFVRLAYGVVGSYKDTSSMTTHEVIEEFLNHNGVSTPGEYFKKKFKGGNKPKTEPEKPQKETPEEKSQ